MLRIYLKQAWSLLKENPLVSGLSIAGTALAITAVMMIILVIQVRLAEYAPETERSRMLHIIATRSFMKSNDGNWNNGGMGKRVVRELFYNLKTPQEVSGIPVTRYPLVPLPNVPLQNTGLPIQTNVFGKYSITHF